MAVALNCSSPSNLNKDSTVSTASSPHLSPCSDKSFWSSLHTRVETILDDRNRESSSTGIGESECDKRFKEDTLLLLQGFDSVASSLSQLTDNLDSVVQGASDLAKPSLTELLHRDHEQKEQETQQRLKRQGSPHKSSDDHEARSKRQCTSHESSDDNKVAFQNESKRSPASVSKNEKMMKARNLAVSMGMKAASLARELKSIKSNLCFMQERCTLLEEENRRLRDGFAKGERPDEDDLVRLQLEALLAEKSRLANENANLTRENQCLHQLVEYHQLTTQDLSASYEQAIHGMCLDFSSPIMEDGDDDFYGDDDIKSHRTPITDSFEFPPSLDKHFEDQI